MALNVVIGCLTAPRATPLVRERGDSRVERGVVPRVAEPDERTVG